MEHYKETLFNAFMWLQSIENLLRDCIKLNCSIDHSREIKQLEPIPDERRMKNIHDRWGLGGLAWEAHNYSHGIDQQLTHKLIKLGNYRNKLGHNSFNGYMQHIILNNFGGDDSRQRRIHREIKSYELMAQVCGAYMGPLLRLHTKLSEEHSELALKPLDENFSCS